MGIVWKPALGSASSVVVLACLLPGCSLAVRAQALALAGAPYSVKATIEYSPTGISSLSKVQLDPLAVYLLLAAPERATAPNLIGEISVLHLSRRGESVVYNRILGREEVTITVTQALAAGLKARGFPILDRTNEMFLPGKSQPGAPLALHGQVLTFWTEAFNSGQAHWGSAECAVRLQVHETEAGRDLWEKIYRSRESGVISHALAADELSNLLAKQLATIVATVVNDPEFLSHVSRRN